MSDKKYRPRKEMGSIGVKNNKAFYNYESTFHDSGKDGMIIDEDSFFKKHFLKLLFVFAFVLGLLFWKLDYIKSLFVFVIENEQMDVDILNKELDISVPIDEIAGVIENEQMDVDILNKEVDIIVPIDESLN